MKGDKFNVQDTAGTYNSANDATGSGTDNPALYAGRWEPGVSLLFDSVTGRVYDVLYRDNLLTGDWLDLTNDLPGTDEPLNVDDPAFGGTGPGMASRRFYRIRVRLP